MLEFRKALRARKAGDPHFNGTVSAASKLMDCVGHQQLRNLMEGRAKPYGITVHTKNELLRVFAAWGLREEHFERPGTTPPPSYGSRAAMEKRQGEHAQQ